MSLLPADVHAELTQLLQALQSADNGIRSQAEEHLQNNWTVARPEVLLMGLAEQVQGAGDNAVGAHLPCPPKGALDRGWPRWHGSFVSNAGPLDSLFCCCHLQKDRVKDPQGRVW